MKQIKRLLIALLILAFAFTLALPAFAQDSDNTCPYCTESAPCPDMPRIIQQPPATIVLRSDAPWRTPIVALLCTAANNWQQMNAQWYIIRGDEEPRQLSQHQIGNSPGAALVTFEAFQVGDRLFVVIYNRNDSTASDGPHRVQSETTTVTGLRGPTLRERIDDFRWNLRFFWVDLIFQFLNWLYQFA